MRAITQSVGRGADLVRWIAEDIARRMRPSATGGGAPAAEAGPRPSKVRWALGAFARGREEVALLRDGFRDAPSPYRPAALRAERTLYLSDNSLPHNCAGYAVRTHGLATGLRALGFDAEVLTRLGYPQGGAGASDTVDGVPYLRARRDAASLAGLGAARFLRANVAAATAIARERKPALVHGASNFMTGLAAMNAAKAIGAPSVYEVRGLWEITALSRDPAYARSLLFQQHKKLETETCHRADRVIAITDALKRELIRRGVPSDKISVVPNGVDTARFRRQERDVDLAQRLGFAESDVVVGYAGSVLDYEGIDDLLRAVRLCIDGGAAQTRMLIVGDGPALAGCKALAAELGLSDRVVFTGRKPHAEIARYYGLIDIAPFPRKALPVCEMVSPLKPFEAMAMEKCVIVSDVAALAEIIGDRPIGLVHAKNDIGALARTLAQAIGDEALRRKLGAAARAHVVAHHDWRILAQRVAELYGTLGVHAGAAGNTGAAPAASSEAASAPKAV